jgi:hypothetical protein
VRAAGPGNSTATGAAVTGGHQRKVWAETPREWTRAASWVAATDVDRHGIGHQRRYPDPPDLAWLDRVGGRLTSPTPCRCLVRVSARAASKQSSTELASRRPANRCTSAAELGSSEWLGSVELARRIRTSTMWVERTTGCDGAHCGTACNSMKLLPRSAPNHTKDGGSHVCVPR